MINTPDTQRKFLQSYGPIADFDSLFVALRRHLEKEALQLPGSNRLLGVYWILERTNVPYLGKSIEHRQLHIQRKSYNKNKDLGYSGKIWFRLDRDLVGSPSHMFAGSMIHIGTGGYSTFGGKWQNLGLELQKMEQGIPVNLRRELAAYCFQCHFYVSDFPDLDQLAIMKKLSDQELPQRINNSWVVHGLTEQDDEYKTYLKSLKESTNE